MMPELASERRVQYKGGHPNAARMVVTLRLLFALHRMQPHPQRSALHIRAFCSVDERVPQNPSTPFRAFASNARVRRPRQP
eukprot:2683128-Rhodomonas_salina.2